MKHFLFLIALLALIGPMSYAAPAPPVIVPDASTMTLDDLGLYEVGYVYRGKPEVQFPVGWSGDFDDKTGVACEPMGVQNGREAWLLHCPWKNGTGVSFQTFTFQMPAATHIELRGATAMRTDAVGKSDGVTFRVYVAGQKQLDVNRTDSQWQPFDFDLTAYAGKSVAIRFETDPGPKDNSSFDFALWGSREIVLTGFAPQVKTHPDPPALDLTRLTSAQTGSVVPPSGFAGHYGTVIGPVGDPTKARFDYEGADGFLIFNWQKPDATEASLLGKLSLSAVLRGDRPAVVPLAGGSRLEWALPTGVDAAVPISSRFTYSIKGVTLTRVYQIGAEQATVSILGHMVGKSLVFDVSCDKPFVRTLDGGGWGPVMRRRPIGVPYYSNAINFLPAENLFAGAFLDWTNSSASNQSGTRANYDALTDGTRALLQERLVYTAAWHLAETLPNIPNAPSPFRVELGERPVLDIWGGSFDSIQARLHMLADYGIAPGVALVHDWQRSGYDNALPAHVPANKDYGGDPAMTNLVTAGRADGYRMALHENYVDYYPNYDLFSIKDIALNSDGAKINAWYNEGTKIQSFAVKPTAILRLAHDQGQQVKTRYNSDACYLDVHSAVPPWFHVDMDASQAGAGKFQTVFKAHKDLWAYERQLHNGPVFGEGNNHWYWSGLLDGVEAQFGQGWHDGSGDSAPLFVDFDLLKIHPLQFNHGMGYYERWWAHGPGPQASLMTLLDQYRMQEVAYGHAAFLGASTWSSLPSAWLETHLLGPVMARYAAARPTEIAYQVGGRWVDGTKAAKAGDFSRLRVRYDNGLAVTANNSDQPLLIGTLTLPRFGWAAQGAGVQASTSVHDGVRADYAETADSLFANARPQTDWGVLGHHRLRPEVAGFAPTGPRAFRAAYQWAVGENPAGNYNAFVHFVQPGAPNDGIRFQQDHALSTPSSQWKAGQTVTDGPYDFHIPADLPAGDYQWMIGLSDTTGRLTLEGADDGHDRILLGVLHVGPDSVSFTPQPPPVEASDPLLNQTDKVVDFGTMRTNGSVWIHRVGKDWALQTFPRDRAFALELLSRRFPMPSLVRAQGKTPEMITPQSDGAFWRLPLNGAREYRWAAGP